VFKVAVAVAISGAGMWEATATLHSAGRSSAFDVRKR